MSGVLSSEREALRDVNHRIDAIERRLKNARAARDAYVDYLRSKYPLWRPAALPPPQSTTQVNFLDDVDIFSQLETSGHFWDINRQPARRLGKVGGRLYNEIPPSGLLLESDLPRMRRRLNEINGQLRLLREHRSIIPSDEYFRSTLFHSEPVVSDRPSTPIIISSLQMHFSSPPVFEISPERMAELRMKEEMEQLIVGIREGRIPSVVAPPPTAPLNIPSCSIEATVRNTVTPPPPPPPPPPSSSIPTKDERSRGPRVQFETPAREESKKEEEEKSEPPKSNYQAILSILSKDNPPPETDSEDEKKNARSFDDVFGQPQPAAQPPKRTTATSSKMSMALDAFDSDEDFFQ
ncbi:hypothetical protein PMAYCL1PPCAC_29059 [Pristionchus mayeri]|uniref:Uncharacterized protein n=1 Tax=Pristionchus mayeri TaxID=1317129 RepID=A0AAN5D9B1_9BILA|nr:hypothetical protein PMAYCL1PPCAC_29059 [Pristionchus mayeri]